MRDGWVQTPIGDVAQVLSGFAFKSELFNKTEGIPLIRIRDLPKRDSTEALYSGSYEDRYVVKKGDFLIGMDGEFHCYEWNGPNALLNQRVCRIQDFKLSIVIPRYIYFAVNQYLDKIEQETGYTTVKHISAKQVLGITIPLPPLPEQKRIVDLISSVDSYIEALQQQLETAKRSRNAVLHELLSAGDDSWIETTLGEVADVIDPHPSHRAPAVDDNGIPFIGIGDLRNTGDIDFAKARRVSRDILEEHKARYNRSDFLIGLGRVASIGMVVRLPDENTEYVVSPTLAVINAKDVLGQFLFYLLEGPHSQEQFQRFKKGSTRESVGMQILRKIRVHIPPLPEQKRIVEIIKSIDDVLNTTSSALSVSKKLRSGMLSDLLSGKHEIPASYDNVIGAA